VIREEKNILVRTRVVNVSLVIVVKTGKSHLIDIKV